MFEWYLDIVKLYIINLVVIYNSMSKNRCFSNQNKYKTSSDYTKQTKQQTIFTDVVQQVQTQTNFIKSNGVNYNENFGLHNGCLSFAKSYELLLDVTKGKYYTAPVQDPNWVSDEAWSASLYSVDYSANHVNTVVDTSYNAGNGNHVIFPMTQPAELADISWNGLYPGVIVDPSYNIFYNRCKDQNYWRKNLVDMSFNNTNYSKQSKQDSEELYGMYYPTTIKFNCYPNTDIPCDSSIHGSATFNYTGTIQTFTKPAGVCDITIEAIGGGGGGGAFSIWSGGGGGKVTSSFNVPVIESTFNIYVGGGGEKYSFENVSKGGISLYNYGTNGETGSGGDVTGTSGAVGGAGGGLSCVIINQQNSYSINRQMLIIAGGGGGASDGNDPSANGGFGGGDGTADGEDAPNYTTNNGSMGGKADGTGGAGGGGVSAGGSGGNNGNNVGNGGNNVQNGAGGGGYGGGSGGGGNNTPGGGGSSFSNGYTTTYAYIASHTNTLPGEGGSGATSGQPGKITITY